MKQHFYYYRIKGYSSWVGLSVAHTIKEKRIVEKAIEKMKKSKTKYEFKLEVPNG